jgi:hypothetical protein
MLSHQRPCAEAPARAEDLLLDVLQLLEGDLSRERLGLAGFTYWLERLAPPGRS